MILPVMLAASLVGTRLQVTNIDAGTLVLYPVVLLRGTAPDATNVIIGTDWKHMGSFPVVHNRFVGLVELKPGMNMALLQSAKETVRFRLDYRPIRSPYHVVSVYLAAKDEPTDYQTPPGEPSQLYGEKLDVALKLLQCFAAEAMNQAGYGRKTFPLEFNDKGKVVVQVVRSDELGPALRARSGNELWSLFDQQLSKEFPYSVNRCCAVMSFTRYFPSTHTVLGHTALGGDGLGLFGGGSMWSWPTTLAEVPRVFSDARPIDPDLAFDDSGNRGTRWALAATTLGAMIHEMGHTFGLPHSADPESVMSRGFDHLNRMFSLVEPPRKGQTDPTLFTPDQVARYDAFHAARLNWNPWFQPDVNPLQPLPSQLPPQITVDSATDEYVIESAYGLRVVGTEAENRIAVFDTYAKDAPRLVRISRKVAQEHAGARQFTVYAEDEYGNESRLEIK